MPEANSNKDDKNNKGDVREHKLYKGLSMAFTVVVVVLVIIFRPIGIPFKQIPFVDIGLLIVRLFVIALFIERATEVIIKSWRGKGKQALQAVCEAVKSKSQPDLNNPNEKKAKEELDTYTAETKTIAILTLLALGLTVSALGIRALQSLVDETIFKTLSCSQKAFFYGIDTFATGALLGGGSLGIHKILDAFFGMVDKFKKWTKEDKESKKGKNTNTNTNTN